MSEVVGFYDTVLRRLPSLVNGKIPVDAQVGGGNQVSAIQLAQVTTNNTTPVQLANIACHEIVVENPSGADLLIGYGSTSPTVFLSLPDGMARQLPCVANANEWWIRRATSGSNVTVTYMTIQRG